MISIEAYPKVSRERAMEFTIYLYGLYRDGCYRVEGYHSNYGQSDSQEEFENEMTWKLGVSRHPQSTIILVKRTPNPGSQGT